jgi:hypothetical protein
MGQSLSDEQPRRRSREHLAQELVSNQGPGFAFLAIKLM